MHKTFCESSLIFNFHCYEIIYVLHVNAKKIYISQLTNYEWYKILLYYIILRLEMRDVGVRDENMEIIIALCRPKHLHI